MGIVQFLRKAKPLFPSVFSTAATWILRTDQCRIQQLRNFALDCSAVAGATQVAEALTPYSGSAGQVVENVLPKRTHGLVMLSEKITPYWGVRARNLWLLVGTRVFVAALAFVHIRHRDMVLVGCQRRVELSKVTCTWCGYLCGYDLTRARRNARDAVGRDGGRRSGLECSLAPGLLRWRTEVGTPRDRLWISQNNKNPVGCFEPATPTHRVLIHWSAY